MSTVGLVIAFVVYAVLKAVSASSKDNAPAAPQPQGEVFPPVESEEEVVASPGPVIPVQGTAAPAAQGLLKRSTAVVQNVAEEQLSDNKAAPKQKQERIRIKGKTEARRAFIYSEIFNRKY